MKKQGFNPYLPSWEYIPDGEPYIFDGRVYVYGSHDRFNGYVYCMNDYVCWSAPEDDLSEWRYEGIIYRKTDDPFNRDGNMNLYAPDVTRGPDGRYYLFYVFDKMDVVSVAVCDSPAGKYEFYGYVHYPDGTMLGRREGDVPQFDPGVLTEGEKTYLYTGQCSGECKTVDKSRTASVGVVLDRDMLTVTEGPVPIVPGRPFADGTGFEGHEFFEASSIRKIGGTYYFVYSSFAMNELCYATSKNPLKDFVYGGVIVSNADINIGTYKPAEKPMYCGGNNHGSIIEIKKDGSIPQVEMTSCGPNLKPLAGRGEYPAYIACNIFSVEHDGKPMERYWPRRDPRLPFISQDGKDGDEETGFVTNINDNCGVGFKYFDCRGVTEVSVKTRGYCRGVIEVKTSWDGEPLGQIEIMPSNNWKEFSANVKIPDGIQALYFVYRGKVGASIGSFTLK